MRTPQVFYSLVLICLLSFAFAPVEHADAQADMLTFPADIGWNVRDYGARGDGMTDDTAAIQALLRQLRPQWADYMGNPRLVYFPPGVYLVRDTLGWPGCCIALQGAGSGQTVIKLIDNTPGFTNPAAPKAVIRTEQGNMSFQQYVRDMTIDVGRGNRGAIALDYISSNTGAVRNVVIVSGDGQGLTGIAMTRQWPGPQLIRNVRISGFQVGIDVAHAEYGVVFEDIFMTNISVAGIRNDTNTLAIRRLRTSISAPAIISNRDGSSIILLDSDLQGGAAGTAAVQAQGDLYMRNVTTGGYAAAISVDGTVVPGTSVTEYVRGTRYRLDPTSIDRMLNLPIRDVPSFHNNDLATWGRFNPGGYDSGSSNRSLRELFANPAYTTIYLRSGASIWGNSRISVPAHVRRIVSFMHQANNWDGVGLELVVDQASTEPLIIEGVGAHVIHASGWTVVMKDGGYRYTAQAGAGDVYFDNVVMDRVVFQPGQHVWGWQFNTEHSGDVPMVINNGADVWLFGVKTEGNSTVVDTRGGGRSEIFGMLLYPACAPMPDGRAAFINSESHVTLIMSGSIYAGCRFYPTMVRETRGGVTRELLSNAYPWRTLPLYAGAGVRLIGDINGDGVVSLIDFSLLVASYNKRSGDAGYDARADLNGDNAVTLQDFSLLAGNYNRTG